MRFVACVLLASLLWLGLVGTKQSPKHEISNFTDLASGDSILIDMVSDGCFNHDHYQFTFGRLPVPTVSILEFEDRWDGNKRVGKETIYRGSLALTEKDLKGLDNLLSFYRGPIGDGCTTVDKVTLKQLREGHVVTSESVEDASCGLDAIRILHPKNYNYVSLRDLLSRLPRENSSEQPTPTNPP